MEAFDNAEPPRPEPGPKLPKALESVAKGGVVIGGKVVLTTVEPEVQEQKLVLKSWDLSTAKPNEPVVLFRGKDLHIETVDGGRRVLARGDGTWRLFTLETSKEEAQFPHEEGTGWVSVAGPRAYYAVHGTRGKYPPDLVETKTLKAVDLKTGKVIWERLLETVRFPQPPY